MDGWSGEPRPAVRRGELPLGGKARSAKGAPVRRPLRLIVVAWLLPLVLAGALPARAADRPWISTNSAAADEDDNGTWAFDAWATRLGAVRGAHATGEYTFVPTTSLQVEAVHERDRDARESSSAVGLEFKHLLNHIARDGYGWGVVAQVSVAKTGSGAWKRDEVGLKAPFTLSLWEGDGALHVNAGMAKPRDERRAWTRSVALERELIKRVTGFAELAREGPTRIAQLGARYWIKREKLVVDLAWQQQRTDGARASGWLIGFGWYDF